MNLCNFWYLPFAICRLAFRALALASFFVCVSMCVCVCVSSLLLQHSATIELNVGFKWLTPQNKLQHGVWHGLFGCALLCSGPAWN